MDGIFSKSYERKLLELILKAVNSFLERYKKPKPRLLGLMTPKEVQEELDIKANTLKRWEDNGFKRYQPPLEDTRKVFYKVSDILVFLEVENGSLSS